MRKRGANGRFLSKRSIAAIKGWVTRRRRARARVKAAKVRTAAAKHGARARVKTERRLTPKQKAARKQAAARIERAASRPKKAPRRTGARGPSRRWIRSRKESAPRSSAAKLSERLQAQPRRNSLVNLTVGGESSGDALQVQIAVSLTVPESVTDDELRNKVFNEAVKYRALNGEDHPLAKTEILRWRNPGRKRGELREWRQGNQADAWTTLGPAIVAAMNQAEPV